jgi:hypothetical protein
MTAALDVHHAAKMSAKSAALVAATALVIAGLGLVADSIVATTAQAQVGAYQTHGHGGNGNHHHSP